MNEKININEIISVKQLPKIFYELEKIGEIVDKALEGIENMVCDEENKKDVKKRKQEITAFKNLMETRRKEIKNQVMAKYNEFNDKYEEEVKNKLINAENILTEKYTAIETQQKLDKENELREFAQGHFEYHNIQDIVKFEDIGLNITLTASIKSLKEQVLDFCKKITADLELIELEEFKDEIWIEYIQSLNFANAKIIVSNRHKQLEEMQKKQEELQKKKEEEQQIIEKNEEIIEEITMPQEIEVTTLEDKEEVYTITFKVTARKSKLKELKEFLQNGGYDYE